MSARIAWIATAFIALAAVAFAPNTYWLFVLAMVGITCVVGAGLNVLTGLTGQVSIGHAGFFAIGAYTNAIITTKAGLAFWWTLPAAFVLTGLLGLVLAAPALRVRGPYLAMVTIAFGIIVESVIVEWEPLTGGFNGISEIPKPSLFGLEFGMRSHAFLVAAITVLVLVALARLDRSRVGTTMRAVRDAETAAAAVGINPLVVRSAAFAISAACAGVAGALYAPLAGFISPESFSFYQSILFLLVVILGGVGTVAGPLVGALILTGLPELLARFAEYRLLFFGALLLLLLWLAPEGIVGAWQRRFGRRAASPVAGDAQRARTFVQAGARPEPLVTSGLGIRFGGVVGAAGVDLTATAGRVTALIGPNGAGKTTLLNLIGGFYRPDEGTVALGARAIGGRATHAVARAGVARTFQATQLFASLSVVDNVQLAVGPDAADSRRTANDLLAFVGYAGDGARLAGDLPFVDRRLVETARALATRPEALLLDEPAAGLNRQDTERLAALIRALADCGLKVLLVEHDMALVMSISDRVLVLDAGRIIASGAPAAVQTDAAVIEAYLGSGSRMEEAPARAITSEPVLEVQDLRAGYGSLAVLEHIDLRVREGELVALVGVNGAGKSTLLRALSGLIRPSGGTARYRGEDVTALAPHEIVARGMVMVPEGRQVFPELTVHDNLRLGAYTRKDGGVAADMEGFLARFPRLRERLASRAGLLSGGEQQMLAIARGLMGRPTLILLDEPSLGLAPKLVDDLYGVVRHLRDEGRTIVLVDQFANLALALADRAYVLANGRVVKDGEAAALRRDPEIQAAYLGGR